MFRHFLRDVRPIRAPSPEILSESYKKFVTVHDGDVLDLAAGVSQVRDRVQPARWDSSWSSENNVHRFGLLWKAVPLQFQRNQCFDGLY